MQRKAKTHPLSGGMGFQNLLFMHCCSINLRPAHFPASRPRYPSRTEAASCTLLECRAQLTCPICCSESAKSISISWQDFGTCSQSESTAEPVIPHCKNNKLEFPQCFSVESFPKHFTNSTKCRKRGWSCQNLKSSHSVLENSNC